MSHQLAIVLAAYKPDFLIEAVNSVLNQSDQRFNLYIFDDSSPHDLENLLKHIKSEKYNYHKFENNVGRNSIVKQWERCIENTCNEEWIWIFSDDDVMDPQCVQQFYQTRNRYPGYNSYRFNTRKIKEDGEVIRENHFPEVLSAEEFLNIKLAYKQESYIIETIFSRQIYQKIGGIPDMPLAWASDDIFTVKLAKEGGVRRIDDAFVNWRYSTVNISGANNKKGAFEKMKASRKFVHWIYRQPNILEEMKPPDLPVQWYIRQLKTLQKQLRLTDEIAAVIRMAVLDRRVWKYYIQMKIDRSRLVGWLKKFFL